MELNFDDEQDEENTENHMKIPNSDRVFKEQVKLEQIQNLKSSIKANKVLLIFIIIFCSLFSAYQLLQDYRISSYQKEVLELKKEIEEMKKEMNSNINFIQNHSVNKNKTNDNNQINENDNVVENKPKNIINFSAETIVLKDKFNQEIKYLQDCMLETKIKIFDKIENPKISIIVPIYKKESYIYRFIKSIQKQDFTELEMIFVQDFSLEKKHTKIEELNKLDKRIAIIKNNKNTTLLNSYINGISAAKSEFILFLEEDSILLPNFTYIYEITKNEDKDINEYSCLKGTLNGITLDEKISNIEKSKEEVIESYYNFNFINENPLMNKIIKTEALKNSLKYIKQHYLDENFDLHVDSLIYICLCSYADSYKSFGNLYISFNLKKEISKEDIFLERMFNSSIILANFIYELKHQDMDIFNQRCLLVYNLINWPLNYNRKLNIDSHKSNIIINKFMTNKFINEDNIRKLKNLNRRIIDRMKNKIL